MDEERIAKLERQVADLRGRISMMEMIQVRQAEAAKERRRRLHELLGRKGASPDGQ